MDASVNYLVHLRRATPNAHGMTRAHAILFDLDGTLLDTAPDMIGALNLLRQEEGLEPLPFSAARSSVSHGAVRLVTVGFPSAQGDEFERLRQRFLAIYSENLAAGTRLFAGLEQVLAAFEVEGLPWGVVTNKPGWLTDPLLRATRPDQARLLRGQRRHGQRAQAASPALAARRCRDRGVPGSLRLRRRRRARHRGGTRRRHADGGCWLGLPRGARSSGNVERRTASSSGPRT